MTLIELYGTQFNLCTQVRGISSRSRSPKLFACCQLPELLLNFMKTTQKCARLFWVILRQQNEQTLLCLSERKGYG